MGDINIYNYSINKRTKNIVFNYFNEIKEEYTLTYISKKGDIMVALPTNYDDIIRKNYI